MNHVEGGWPKDVDYTEAEHVIRYRKKVEKDEEYIKTLVSLGGQISHLIQKNNCIDVYQEYFRDMPSQFSTEVPSAHTVTVLKDPNTIRKGV